jgi:16S rRNA (cytidine1402-2'-O)-methyltransferase
MNGKGKLFIVGTPIGNLGDLSPRALEALKSADLVLCEDTRHTRKLLTHFGIDKPTQRFDDHTEDARGGTFADLIEAGQTVALVSDAGMPVISDPGFRLVRIARERGLTVEPVPGPFAGVLALAASGIAPLPFTFLGFTPHRHGERLDFYRDLATLGHTAIVYESPERLLDSLRDARDVSGGNVEITVAREMTKLHEELIHGTLDEVIANLEQRPAIYGEVTIVFAAAPAIEAGVSPAEIAAEFETLRSGGMRRNDAIKVIAEKFGLRKNDVYKMLLSLNADSCPRSR